MLDNDAPPFPAGNSGGTGTQSLAQDPELVSEFILESQDHLRSIEGHLLAIDGGNASGEALNAIFRGFHTIKG